MRAKFGSVLDANVTDENCEFRCPTFFYHVNGNLGHSWRTCGRSEAKVLADSPLRRLRGAALCSRLGRPRGSSSRAEGCLRFAWRLRILANECAAASRTWPLASGPASIGYKDSLGRGV